MKYTAAEKKKLFDRAIKCMESGMTVTAMLARDDTPTRNSLYRWLDQDTKWQERFARAGEISDEVLFDQALEVARTPLHEDIEEEAETDKGTFRKVTRKDNVARSRLIVYTIEQRLARRNPRKYGTKIDVTSGDQPINMPVITGMVIKNETDEELPTDDDLL